MAATDGPSTLSVVVGTAIISLLTGYMLGTASSLGFLPSPFGAKSPVAPIIRAGRDTSHYDDEEESSEEEIDDPTVLNHAPNWANSEKADKRDGLRNSALQQQAKRGAEGKEQKVPEGWDLSEESKLVLVVRTDLGMTKGKIAAQCGHATLACYKTSLKTGNPALKRWERQGQAKVALQVKSEDEMMELMGRALSLGIVAEVIADAGRTQIASGSHTVLGVGPAPKSIVDKVTGGLKLL